MKDEKTQDGKRSDRVFLPFIYSIKNSAKAKKHPTANCGDVSKIFFIGRLMRRIF